MQRKFIEHDSKPLYEIEVTLRDPNHKYKLKKTYQDFLDLEQHIVDMIQYNNSKKRIKTKIPLISKKEWSGSKLVALN
jgi:hypothetical protein